MFYLIIKLLKVYLKNNYINILWGSRLLNRGKVSHCIFRVHARENEILRFWYAYMVINLTRSGKGE